MRIREFRKARNITQAQLAERLGVSQSTVCGWENETVKIPIDKLIALADLFDCALDALLGRESRYTASA